MVTKLENLITPGGRLIMGSLTTKGAKDHENKPIPPEKQRYFFGLAVPKTTPGVMELINQLWVMAATDYAQVPLVMAQINQGLAAKDFSFKIDDGDAPSYDKRTGQLKAPNENAKGCFIFKFSTNFEVNCCDALGVDISRNDVKIGDYAAVVFSSMINGKNDDTAGIYLNPNAVCRLGFGDAISGGAPASQMFAGRIPTPPPGATQMPTMPPGAVMPQGMPQQPQYGMPQPGQQPQQPQYGMPQPGQQPQQPQYGMPQPGQQPQQPQYGMPQPGQQPQYQQMQHAQVTPAGMPQPGNFAPGGMPMGHAPSPGMPAPTGAYPTTASPNMYPGILNPGQGV